MAVRALIYAAAFLCVTIAATDVPLASLKQQSQGFVSQDDDRWTIAEPAEDGVVYPKIAQHCLENVEMMDNQARLERLQLCHLLGARAITDELRLADVYVAVEQVNEAIQIFTKVSIALLTYVSCVQLYAVTRASN